MDDKVLFEKVQQSKYRLFPSHPNMDDFGITQSLDWLYQNNVIFIFAPTAETCGEIIEESEMAAPFFLRVMGFGPKISDKLMSLGKNNPLIKLKKDMSYTDKAISHVTYILLPVFTFPQFVDFLEVLITQLKTEGFKIKRFSIDSYSRQYKALPKGETYFSMMDSYHEDLDLFDRPFWSYVNDLIQEDFISLLSKNLNCAKNNSILILFFAKLKKELGL